MVSAIGTPLLGVGIEEKLSFSNLKTVVNWVSRTLSWQRIPLRPRNYSDPAFNYVTQLTDSRSPIIFR